MSTITETQTTLSPELFAKLQIKAKRFGVSLNEFIERSILADTKIKQKEQKLKKWQKEFDTKLKKLPTIKATPKEEQGIAQGLQDIKAGKCKKVTLDELMIEMTA